MEHKYMWAIQQHEMTKEELAPCCKRLLSLEEAGRCTSKVIAITVGSMILSVGVHGLP